MASFFIGILIIFLFVIKGVLSPIVSKTKIPLIIQQGLIVQIMLIKCNLNLEFVIMLMRLRRGIKR